MVSAGVSAVARARPPNPVVLGQHAEDAAVLRNTRSYLVRAPHVRLHLLRRLDERLAAHLDGLDVAGDHGSAVARAALETPGAGQVFTATVVAIERRDAAWLDKVLALAQALPEAQPGAVSAFGWVSAASLRGITRALLDSPGSFRRMLGLAACAMHQVDPGDAIEAAANDADAALRARALRIAGERGQPARLAMCVDALGDEDEQCAFEAVRAAALLGDRRQALEVLHAFGAVPGPWRERALCLSLLLRPPEMAGELLRALSREASDARLLLRCVGVAGDPNLVPWLIEQMRRKESARLAGEAFSLITGADLALLDLESKPPQDVPQAPGDDALDDDVALPEDDSLPWPDADRIAAWWQHHGKRFASGMRWFMGAPVSASHALDVLRTGCQRQRALAALQLCLLRPGMPLFNVAAPAWRQKRWLDAMGP